MKTIVIYQNYQEFPTYYVLDGDYTRLDGVIVGTVDEDQELESIVCDLDNIAEVFSTDFPLSFLEQQILEGNRVAIVVCGMIP